MRDAIEERAHQAIEAGADPAFVAYLFTHIVERIDSGRSFDCDEYRCLHELSSKSAREPAAQGPPQMRDVSEVVYRYQNRSLLLQCLQAASKVPTRQA